MSTSRASRALQLLAAVVAGALALTGCGFQGARSIPLPGGQGMGSDAIKVTVEFQDVLDLVPQSAVKVDDVTVGSVRSIDLQGYTARVVVGINKGVDIPANSTVSLRQTSLLGEKFVSFNRPPAGQAQGQLRGGEVIGLDRTTRSAEIEEVLSALSLVLNGGSIEQIQTINAEVVKALKGRESDVKDLLGQLNVFVGGLDQQKANITRALDSLDRLTARLAADRATIATALQDIPPGVQVLNQERQQITTMLTSLNQLSGVAVQVINASRQNTQASLEALRPILTQLAAAGSDLPNSLELLTTYPFPRSIDQGIKGDYANLFVTTNIDLMQVLQSQTCTGPFAGANCSPPPLPAGVPVPPLPVQQQAQPQQQQQLPAIPLPTPSLPPVVSGQVVPAPSSGGLGGLFGGIGGGGSGGLLGLLIGGLS